jgi:hypothetical protein
LKSEEKVMLYPPPEGGIVQESWPADIALTGKIAEAYKKCVCAKNSEGDGQWLHLIQRRQDIHAALIGNDMQKLSKMLADPQSNELLYGFDEVAKSLEAIVQSNKQGHINLVYEMLVRLSETVGIERMENPEYISQGHPLIRSDLNVLFRKLNELFSCQIMFPNPYRGTVGLKYEDKIVSFRALQALYQAYLIKEKCRGRENFRVLEIGAGLGWTAYHARTLLGIKDYTIIDLPMSGVASSYFLGRVLGRDAVSLYGEEGKTDTIKILPPDSFILEDLGNFDLIINCDSLTEMDYDTMRIYWQRIKKYTTMFVSINHEYNQHTVRELTFNDPFVKTYSRIPYHTRKGYVIESMEFYDKGTHSGRLEKLVLSQAADNIQHHTDNIRVLSGYLIIEGWAYSENDDSNDTQTFIKMNYKEKSAIVSTVKAPRPDVAKAFNNEKYLHSGFTAFIDVSEFDADFNFSNSDYEIYVLPETSVF